MFKYCAILKKFTTDLSYFTHSRLSNENESSNKLLSSITSHQPKLDTDSNFSPNVTSYWNKLSVPKDEGSKKLLDVKWGGVSCKRQ